MKKFILSFGTMQQKRTDVVDYLKSRHNQKIKEYRVAWKLKEELCIGILPSIA